MNHKKLIIIGGGFAGLQLARKLRHAPVDITIIDKHNHHLFQPLLYQVCAAMLSPRDISVALREVFARQKNTNVLMGEVVNIDKEAKEIQLGNGDTLTYDYLAIAIGSRHSYFGNDQWSEFAPGIKTIKDALEIREHLLVSFEKAERLDSISEANKYLTIVVVGGGPTGVEIAGTLAELLKKTLKSNFRKIHIDKAKVILVEGSDRLLPPFHPKLSKRTKKDLEKLGVTVLTNHIVSNITEDGVQVGDQFIDSKCIIWAAGNTIPALINTLDSEQDRQGRVIVENDLSIPNHPELFVLGDAAHFNTKNGPLPGVATVAIQQGCFLAKVLRKELKKKRVPKHRKAKFKYLDKGKLATIGSFKAVGSMGKFKFTGMLAWLIWGVVHVTYLVGFRNRISVMLEWVLHHLTAARAARIIHGTIDEKLPQNKKKKTK